MNYFDRKQYIAQVDKNDSIIGKIDKWEAHRTGILHRAFTVAIMFENKVLIQHRKHPVFNNVLDITISSHQNFQNDSLEYDVTAVLKTLEREWFITEDDLIDEPLYKGNIYYKAEDPLSNYIEHEVCHIYSCTIQQLKMPNLDFAYGFSLQKIADLKNPQNYVHSLLAPWVKKAFEENLL